MNLEKWKTISSKYVVNDRWMKLRADTCVTLTGREIAPYYVIEYGDWASCLVISDDNEVTLLRHYRHGISDYVLEIVAGAIDDGEKPEQAIRRELEEEIGLKNATLYETGVCYSNPANQTNKVHNFLALGGTFDGQPKHENGADFQVTKMQLNDLKKLINNQSEVMQGLHLASIFLALNYLNNRLKKNKFRS